MAGVPNAPLVVADVKDEESLLDMARSARVVINTVGPFRFYGDPVVHACIQAHTDYLDVSGEPEFIERIELDYADKAKAAGCFVVSAAGFDSVPGDIGAYWTSLQFKPPARCTAIDTFITIHAGPQGFRGHFPTFESAVQGVAAAGDLSALRRRALQSRGGRVDLKIPGPKPRIDPSPQYDLRMNAYRVPFLGSDASVCRRTAAVLASVGLPAYHCAFYLTLPSRWALFLYQFFGGVFMFLAKRSWGRTLLLRFPRFFTYGLFSREGPSEQQMAEARFSMTNFAMGYSQGAPTSSGQAPDLHVTTRVAGPEPGYISCSIFVVAAAVVLIEERGKLKMEPGVYTPASLLRSTSYVDRIRQRGIIFEVMND